MTDRALLTAVLATHLGSQTWKSVSLGLSGHEILLGEGASGACRLSILDFGRCTLIPP